MEHHLAKVGVAGSIPVSRFFFLRNFRNGDRARSRVRSPLRSGRRQTRATGTRRPVSRFFLRRRQAKVPDSCLHEMKALWRPPDIEHEMRDGGGDAGWVVLRLAAYYPLFLGTGIGVFTPLRSALSACHWHAAPLAGWRYTGATGAQRPAPLRSAPNACHWHAAVSAPVGAKRVPQARSTVSRFFFFFSCSIFPNR